MKINTSTSTKLTGLKTMLLTQQHYYVYSLFSNNNEEKMPVKTN